MSLRRTLALRRRALRKTVAEARAQAQARLQQSPAVQQERRRRQRRRILVLLLLLLLLLLLNRCECEPELSAPKPVAVVEPTPAEPTAAVVQPKVRRALSGKTKTLPRTPYDNDAVALPPWLTEFRLQVAARSPRLASCFNGSGRPGAWRWGAAVNARTGVVSDHTLEPLAGGLSVSASQRACLLGVLSQPRYHLVVDESEDVLPRRVSLLVEILGPVWAGQAAILTSAC